MTDAGPVYTYVFVRLDLPLAQQMVQTGHVCLAAGAAFSSPDDSRLVLVGAPDEGELAAVLEFCKERQIRAVSFVDPDPLGPHTGEPMGLTAVCTEPLREGQRRRLRRFRLWGFSLPSA